MPNWNPNWNNVRWNWGASNAAISALRSAADRLDSFAYERTRAAAEAQAEWRGGYRNDFDLRLQQTLGQSRDLANQLRDAANRIAQASQRATDEQNRRERDRRRWYEEKRREEEEEERRRHKRD